MYSEEAQHVPARPRRRALTLMVVSGALVLLTAGTAAQAVPPHQTAQHRTEIIRLSVVDDGSQDAAVDADPAGESLGDYIVYHFALADRHGTVVGRLDSYKVLTGTGADIGYLTYVTVTLPGGQITGQNAELLPNPNAPIAVTGGTGRYLGVGGDMSGEDDGATAVIRLTR